MVQGVKYIGIMKRYSSTIKERGSDMVKKIKARFSHGVFKPLEKINIPEGKEFTITIPDEPKKKNFSDALRATAGGWKDTIDCEELIKNIYAYRLISTRPEVKL